MIELATKSADIEAAYHTALSCVLDPECVKDWKPVVDLAERCAEAHEVDHCLRVAALYRSGRTDDELIDGRNTTQVRFTHNVWDWFFQGMLQVKAGRKKSGQAILREKIEMVKLMDQLYPRDQESKIWTDWVYHVQCHTLAIEATDMLK